MLSAEWRDEVIGIHSDDHDGQDINQLAAILDAYVEAQEAHVFRRLLWRRLAAIGLLLVFVEGMTKLVPGSVFAVVCALLCAIGLVGALAEWRAELKLTALIKERS